MKPQHYAAAIGFILFVLAMIFAGSAGRHVVTRYNEAVADNATLKEAVKQRDGAIEGWKKREKELLDLRVADSRALDQKTAELKAANERLTQATLEFQNALDQMSPEDRACALRRVPAAVDRLLTR